MSDFLPWLAQGHIINILGLLLFAFTIAAVLLALRPHKATPPLPADEAPVPMEVEHGWPY
jgi:hypothetical protein